MTNWFDVDKEGLARLLKRKGMAFVLYELVQNGWDTATSSVRVTLIPIEGRPLATLRVEDDDPDGFADLAHAFTLYASSNKKGDPTKRGRFNLGEKLVLAVCEHAEIVSTKGGVRFDAEGRHTLRRKLAQGSVFEGTIRMTRDELAGVLDAARLLLPPIDTYINGERLARRTPLRTFEASLPTEIADEEGYLRRSIRKTEIRVYAPEGQARLYEMGIPVEEIELPWSVDVCQKVPLTMDRESVGLAYLREVSVLVVNEMHVDLLPEQAALPSVQEALADKRILPAAVQTIVDHQYGQNHVTYDPARTESNAHASSDGYAVIPGSAYTRDQWANIRRAGASLPAGQVFPPQIEAAGPSVPESEWTPGMRRIVAYAKALAPKLIDREVTVRVHRADTCILASYGDGRLSLNMTKLGAAWFDAGPCAEVNDLLIHELGHESESNHLSRAYYDALTRLGAKLADLALRDPAFFKGHGYATGVACPTRLLPLDARDPTWQHMLPVTPPTGGQRPDRGRKRQPDGPDHEALHPPERSTTAQRPRPRRRSRAHHRRQRLPHRVPAVAREQDARRAAGRGGDPRRRLPPERQGRLVHRAEGPVITICGVEVSAGIAALCAAAGALLGSVLGAWLGRWARRWS